MTGMGRVAIRQIGGRKEKFGCRRSRAG